MEGVIQNATGGAHPLDLSFIDDEDLTTPWKTPTPALLSAPKLSGPLPASLTLTLADRLYVERAGLPQPLINRLIRLAAFANPAFYKAQAMRRSVPATTQSAPSRRRSASATSSASAASAVARASTAWAASRTAAPPTVSDRQAPV